MRSGGPYRVHLWVCSSDDLILRTHRRLVGCVFVASVRTLKTSSGAIAVQIVHSSRRGSRRVEHLGSAHTVQELWALQVAAAKRLAGDRDKLDLGIELPAVVAVATAEPLPILSSRMGHLWARSAVPTTPGLGTQRLRVRLFAVGGRVITIGRRRILRISRRWPWTDRTATGHHTLAAYR